MAFFAGGGRWFCRGVVLVVVVLVAGAVSPVGAVDDGLAPSGLSAVSSGDGVVLSWDAPVVDAGSVTGYQVLRRRPLFGEWSLGVHVADTASVVTEFVDTDVQAGVRYVYRVAALRGAQVSATSVKAKIVFEPLVEPVVGVVWSAVLTVGAFEGASPEALGYWRWSSTSGSVPTGGLSPRSFTVGDHWVDVSALFTRQDGGLWLAADLPSGFVVDVGGERFASATSNPEPRLQTQSAYRWDATPRQWTVGDTVDVSITIGDEQLGPGAEFTDVPDDHDGAGAVTVGLSFDEAALVVDAARLHDHALEVTGGTITNVEARSTDNRHWDITIDPDGPDEITVTLEVTGDCNQPAAVCTTDGRELRQRAHTAIARLSADASLASLSLHGAVLDPVFDPAVVLYSAQAAPGATQVTVQAAPADVAAAAEVSPEDADPNTQGHQVDLDPAGETTIEITVTAADGTEQAYLVIARVPGVPGASSSALNGLRLTGLAPLGFDPQQHRYELSALPGVSRTTVVPSRAHTGATVDTATVRTDPATGRAGRAAVDTAAVRAGPATVEVDYDDADPNAPGYQAQLSGVGDTVIVNRVTSRDQLTQHVYLTRITPRSGPASNTGPVPRSGLGVRQGPRDAAAELSGLSIAGAVLDPAFAAAAFDYTAAVGTDVATVTVTATAVSGAEAVVIPDDADSVLTGHQVALGPPGSQTAVVVVVSTAGGDMASYVVTVSRDVSTALGSLSVDGHDLVPAFDPEIYAYSTQAAAWVSEVTIRAAVSDAGATIQAAPTDTDTLRTGHQLSLGAPGAETEVRAAFVVRAPGAAQHNTYVITVTRAAADPADAALSSLAVSGHALAPAFDPDTFSYRLVVPADVGSVTVEPVERSPAAAVTVTPVDADMNLPGYQVTLGAVQHGGQPSTTTVTIHVESQDTMNNRTYTIAVTRAAPTPRVAYNPDRDIALLTNRRLPSYPRLWSDGEIMWVLDNENREVLAYDLEAGDRIPGREFELDTDHSGTRGIWSDGETMWVLHWYRVLTYDLATGDRIPAGDLEDFMPRATDFDPHALHTPEGIWSDGEILWVSTANDGDKVYAYDLATGARIPERDLNTLIAAGNRGPMGIWSNGSVMWVADLYSGRLHAYDLETADPLPTLDIGPEALEAAGVALPKTVPMGIWGDGETMWVIGAEDSFIRAITMPGIATAGTQLQTLELEGIQPFEVGRRLDYRAVVHTTVTATTITAVAASPDATVDILPLDADTIAPGHQIALTPGENTVTVAVANGPDTSIYTITITQLDTAALS